MDEKLIWERLASGEALDDLGLPRVHGRVDLGQVSIPEPALLRKIAATGGLEIAEVGGIVRLRGVRWKGLDFRKAKLPSLQFFDCEIDDCCFDGAKCSDWRMWGTSVSNTTFTGADLKEAALGGVDNGRRNSFRDVDFTKANLKGSVHGSADMLRCKFSDTKLKGVNFWGTVFTDCVFAGLLDEVTFNRYAFRGEAFPPNEMRGVDFRNAKMRLVEFRGLDLTNVRWPTDESHYVVQDFPETIDRLLAALDGHSDDVSLGLRGLFEHYRKWLGPNQRTGVVSKIDLLETGGEAAVAAFAAALQPGTVH